MGVDVSNSGNGTNIVKVYSTPPPIIEVIENSNTEIAAFTIIEPGVAGRQGAKGDKGDKGDAPPFFLIDGNIKWATTSSISFNGVISSSLIPYVDSFGSTYNDLGSIDASWDSIFLSSSINFSRSGSLLVSLSAREDAILIGSSLITTSSLGFDDNPIIIKNSNDVSIVNTGSLDLQISGRDTFIVRSGSQITHKINKDGLLIFNNFDKLPQSITGSIAYSSGSFYFGI